MIDRTLCHAETQRGGGAERCVDPRRGQKWKWKRECKNGMMAEDQGPGLLPDRPSFGGPPRRQSLLILTFFLADNLLTTAASNIERNPPSAPNVSSVKPVDHKRNQPLE